jgi:type I restriction enzyme S subunit
LEIPIPPIEVQRKISSLIGNLNDKIAINNKINDNLQQQAAAIFREWYVTNPETEKWPLVTLESLTSLVSRGIAPKYADDSTQIVLNQKCIRDHYIDTSLGRRHRPKVINEKWLQYGDLLINSTGEGTLGRAAQVWFVPENITVDSHVTIVRPQNQLLLFYIGLWGISHEREIEALHTGSTGQTELPRDRVKAMELRLPDNDTLTRFNAVIAPMVSTIVVNQQENARLASVRDALLPKLMSGEIDVTDIAF